MTNLENNPDTITQPVKRGRGRPKGAKNKPKAPILEANENPSVHTEGFSVPKRRGRPKGSKNKPKEGVNTASTPTPPDQSIVAVSMPVQIEASQAQALQFTEAGEISVDNHPVMQAAKWLERKMPIVEIQYYKTRASKQSISVTTSIAMAILSLFNVQDQEIRKHAKI